MLRSLLSATMIATLCLGIFAQNGIGQESDEPTVAEPAAAASVLQQDSDEASPSDIPLDQVQPMYHGDSVQPSANFQAPMGDGFSDNEMNQFIPDNSGFAGGGCGNNMVYQSPVYHAPHVQHVGGTHCHGYQNCCAPVVHQCCPPRRVRLFTGFRRRCCN